MKLAIWDTTGQERFNSLQASYFAHSHAAVIAFDLTDKTSLDVLESNLSELRKNCADNIVRVLVGMKSDKRLEREITKEEAEELASRYEMRYFESSSRTGRNVEEVFSHVAMELYLMDSQNLLVQASGIPPVSASESKGSKGKESTSHEGGGNSCTIF